MARRRLRISCLLLAGMLLCGGGASAQDAEPEAPRIYKWVDENGIAHYTTELRNVPRSLRGLIGVTPRAPSPEPRASRSAAAKPAPRSSVGADRWAETDRAREYEDVWSDGTEDGLQPGDADYVEPGPSPAALAESRREINERIAEIEQDIASDEDALKDILAEPAGDTEEIAYHPDFRTVAERLPKLLAELRDLEDERAQLDTP